MGIVTLVASAIVVVSGIYLHPFLADGQRLPHGVDTSVYIFGSRVVHDLGIDLLSPLGERPAHAILTSVLRDVVGGEPIDQARVSPAVLAVAIGLAGIALGLIAARQRPWVAVAIGVGLAASPFIALTAVGYASNLLFDVFAVAAVAAAIHLTAGGGGAGALILLIGAAAIAHWIFAIGLVLLLALYGMVLLVADIIRAQKGPRTDGRGRRLLVVVALGSMLGAGALLLSPEHPSTFPSTHLRTEAKIAERLPAMELPVAIPLAFAGAGIILLTGDNPMKRTAVPLAMWASAAPVGLLAWQVWDVSLPHRIVPFALGVPVLIVLGAAAVRRWLRTRTLAGRRPLARVTGVVAGTLLVVLGAAWLARAGAGIWERQQAGFTREELMQARTLAAYLEPLPVETTVLVPVLGDRWRPLRALQVALPIERVLHLRAWPWDLGLGEDRLERRLAWKFPGDTVVVYLSAYAEQPEPDGTELAPGVVVVVGPRSREPVTVDPPEATAGGELIRVAALSLIALLGIGLGWTMTLATVSPLAALCLSPAVGAAVLALGGLVLGRLGLPLGRGGGVLAATSLLLLGWIAFAVRSRIGPSGSDDHEDGRPSEPAPGPGGRHPAGQSRVGLE